MTIRPQKLATARNIALTGNATGSATFDGSGNISISTNVNTATNADKLDGYHANDIIGKITAANVGGIVAAALTENGYVKFANGLLIQWGNKWHTNPFPIEFPTACLAMIAGNINRQGERVDNTFAYPIDRTKYYMSSKRSDTNAESNAGGNYVAIGI